MEARLGNAVLRMEPPSGHEGRWWRLLAIGPDGAPAHVWMTAYWDVHPHSAMEMLESITQLLPLPLAHALVRSVVIGWKKKPTYDPDAGGSADHCYLSALILSENFDLADRPWVDRVLPQTLEKELKYRTFERVRDADKRKALIQAIAASIR